MNKLTIVTFISFLMLGCATDPSSPDHPISQSEVQAKTYTYTNLDGNKVQLWKKARNYIATVYGDSKSVLRVEDEVEGTLIGKGLVRWQMINSVLSPYCYSEYDIRFVAKDSWARLQLELLSGAPAVSECTGWVLPSRFGYEQILAKFDVISQNMESTLKGDGKLEAMTDF